MNTGFYILELLEEHDYVIFPGLGAFVVQCQSASWTKDNNSLLPPSRTIVFNPALKMNDGLLANFVSVLENIPAAEVYPRLKRLSDEFRYKLDNGEIIEFESFGDLSFDEKGYHFEPCRQAVQAPESFGLGQAIVRTALTPKVPVKPVGKAKGKKKNRLWLVAIPAATLLVCTIFFLLKLQNTKPDKPQMETATAMQNIAQKQDKTADDMETAKTDEVVENETPQEGNEGKEENIEKEEKKEEPKLQQATTPQSGHPQKGFYYLIGGSFKTEANAEKFFRRLKGKGLEPINLGIIYGYHMIAIGVYATEREAIAARNKVWRENDDEDAWIYPVEKRR